jgi:hypothetical protein
MPDNTNDIDALLDYLAAVSIPEAGRYYRTLTALVAERDALREQLRLANIDQFNTEAEANDRDRELRERLIESALQGAGCATISHQPAAELLGRQAVWVVDGALAAMRKGER